MSDPTAPLNEPTEEMVEAGARRLADSPCINSPKLGWPSWMGTARAVIEAALRAQRAQPVAQIGRDIAGRPILQWIDFNVKHSCATGSKLYLSPQAQTRREVELLHKSEAMHLVLSVVAAKAGVESDKLISMLDDALAKVRALAPAIQQGKETK